MESKARSQKTMQNTKVATSGTVGTPFLHPERPGWMQPSPFRSKWIKINLASLLRPLNQVLTKILSGSLDTVTYTRESVYPNPPPGSSHSLPPGLGQKNWVHRRHACALGGWPFSVLRSLLTQPVHRISLYVSLHLDPRHWFHFLLVYTESFLSLCFQVKKKKKIVQ